MSGAGDSVAWTRSQPTPDNQAAPAGGFHVQLLAMPGAEPAVLPRIGHGRGRRKPGHGPRLSGLFGSGTLLAMTWKVSTALERVAGRPTDLTAGQLAARLDACRTCAERSGGNCAAIGGPIEDHALQSKNRCPQKLWPSAEAAESGGPASAGSSGPTRPAARQLSNQKEKPAGRNLPGNFPRPSHWKPSGWPKTSQSDSRP